jgi:alpha-L-glutamate ligase-like protein
MAVSRNILGMNARNFLYIRRYNSPDAKKIADDKLETKNNLIKNGIKTPNLFSIFYDRDSIKNYDWKSLPERGFVIKPARGYAGAGILAIRKWDGEYGTTANGQTYTVKQLESHILDILEGAYSLKFLPDNAFIEERLHPHPFFKKLTGYGIPDMRVIVFNRIPVMAMIRLSTEESHGKANLHQGAIGFGIDIRTGITTNAVLYDQHVSYIPNTKIKTRGIKIPNWEEVLLLASRAQEISGLGYAGIDIVFDGQEGPMVLEINARPGLSIQNANRASLRSRLERVENIIIPTPERGVEIAKNLFTESFSEKVSISPKILTIIQEVTFYRNGEPITVKAKLDTGAYRTSIDRKFAELLDITVLNEKVFVKSASGESFRPTAKTSFILGGKKINTVVSVVDRSNLKYPVIVGHRDMKDFLIKPVNDQPYDPEDDAEE